MRKILYITVCCLAVALVGCKEFYNPFAGEKPLAKVGDKSLYMSEIGAIFTPGITPADSVQLLKSYVEMWVKRQLKTQEAEHILKNDQQDVDRMVEEYRHSLLNYRLDQYYVDRMLDTTFTQKEVETYYIEHKGDFILDRAIVKGEIVKVPASYRQQAKLKELMASDRDVDRQDFTDLCLKNGFALQEFPRWTDFAEFAGQLPGKPDEAMLKKGGVQELALGADRYLFRITDYRLAGDPNPLERVEGVIRRVLTNQRKAEIVRRYEDSIYNVAVQEKKVTINVK